MTKIYLLTGPHSVESFDFKGENIYVGRSSDNDIQVKDRYVSRKHLKIISKGGRCFVRDLESKNGTFVDGHFLASGRDVEVKERTPIVIGMSVLSVGEECSEDVLAFLSSMDLSGEFAAGHVNAGADRPMTPLRNMEPISRVTGVFRESSDINGILGEILDHILQFLRRIDRGAIFLIDQETGEISESVSRTREDLEFPVIKYDLGVVNQVLKARRAVMIPQFASDDEEPLPDSLAPDKIKSVMCVPLINKSRVRGAIYVDSIRRPHGFRKEDLSLFKVLSNRAAMALADVLPEE